MSSDSEDIFLKEVTESLKYYRLRVLALKKELAEAKSLLSQDQLLTLENKTKQ